MAPDPPLVSVLVTTYNGERYLEATLASVVSQTYEHLEIIVRDDASSDATHDIVRDHAARDHRVTLFVNEENLGAEENFRAIYTMATGGYVKWVNQDDLLRPTCIERLVGPMQAAPELTLATSRRELIDSNGTVLPDVGATQSVLAADGRVPGLALGDLCLRYNLNFIGEPTTVLLRNGAADASELWCLGTRTFRINADLALWLRLLSQGPAYYVTEVLSSFRLHDAQRTMQSATPILGTIEWAHLIEAAESRGFLADPVLAREARSSFIRVAGSVAPTVTDPGLLAELMDLVARHAQWVASTHRPPTVVVPPWTAGRPADRAQPRRAPVVTPQH